MVQGRSSNRVRWVPPALGVALASGLSLLIASCATSPPPPLVTSDACAEVEDWRSEVIELPPAFAPSLPSGRETLRFAPGMFEADSDTYFTYAFVLALDEAPPADAAYFESLFQRYFVGLMTAVAKDKEAPLEEAELDAFAVHIEPTDGGFVGHAEIVDAFVTREKLRLELTIDVDGPCVEVRASPKARDHAVWRALGDAARCLTCTNASAPAAP